MAAKKEAPQNFDIHAKITLEVYKTIPAASLENALEQGRHLSVTDFISFDGSEANDHEVTLCGVFKS